MNIDIKLICNGLGLLASLPGALIAGPSKSVAARPDGAAWEDEREEILERANWLCKEIITDPESLMQKAPAVIGREYQGEWAIYCCSMLTHALSNISVLYPDKREKCPDLIARLIDIVNTPTIREYDTKQWKEDAMATLDGPNSHMTYLSILAWMISNYKMCGGDGRYDEIFHRLCATLNRRMLESPYDLNLLSFPRKPVWLPDMMVTLVALRNYGRLYGGMYDETVNKWLANAKTKWLHAGTGLLAGQLPGQGRLRKGMVIRGSHSALVCSYMALVDEEFARDQYEKMCKHLRKQTSFMGRTVCGVREYIKKDPEFKAMPGDAGLVVKGISAGGTAFALGAATYLGDWEFRYQMLSTAEIAGGTKKEKGMRHYKLSEMFMVGEATALAMRTQIRR